MVSNVQQYVPFKKVGSTVSFKSDDVLGVATGRCATLTVAANNSSALSKAQADYVCDGTADDVEIQAAIDALPAVGGKVIGYEGTFNLSASITMPSYVTLSGMGHTTILKAVVDEVTPIINSDMIGGNEGIIISDLTIDGNKAIMTYDGQDNTRNAIHWENVSKSIINRVNAHDCKYHAIALWSGCKDNLVTNCISYDNGSAEQDSTVSGIIVYSAGARNILSGNIIFGNRENPALQRSRGIYISESLYTIVENNLINDCDGYGIFVFNTAHNTIITGNVVNNCSRHGIYLEGSGGNFVTGCVISNNICVNNTISGIKSVDSTKCIISNNVVTGSGTDAIVISNSDNHNIGFNFLYDNGAANTGLVISSDSSYCNIIGNQIIGQSYNLKELDTCDYNIIKDNQFSDSSVTAFLIAGNHSIFYDKYTDLLMDVLAVSATYIRSNEDLSEAIPNTFTIDAQPDVPRTLSGHFDAHAQITAYTIEITGVDAKGTTITETITEADGWDWETSNAFATITSIIMTARTGTGAADTMDIGITDVLGLSNTIYSTSDVFKIKKNNANATVATAQVNATYNTYDMSVIGLGAGDDFTIWYKSNLNIIS